MALLDSVMKFITLALGNRSLAATVGYVGRNRVVALTPLKEQPCAPSQ